MSSPRALSLASLLTLSFAACLPEYNGPRDARDLADPDPATSDPSQAPPPADLAGTVQVDMFVTTGPATVKLSADTATLRLNEKKTITVTVTPNTATGTATLSLVGAPAGLTASFSPATVNLSGSPVTSTMTLTATSNMDPATSVAATVQASVGGTPSSTTLGVTVLPELVVYIAAGVATMNNPMAFGATTIPVKLLGAGTKITFINNDGIEHRIHADGVGGLDHETNNMGANGGTYTDTLTAKGPINFNCHIHAGMTGMLDVQ